MEPTLLSPDHGVLPDGTVYPDRVAALFTALTAADRACSPGPDGAPGEATARSSLPLYTADGLLEVLEWAAEGTGSDETACQWLAWLRWAPRCGTEPPESSPRPLGRWIDDRPVPTAPAPGLEDTLAGLATGRMGEVAHPVLHGLGDSSAVLRALPLGLVPHVGWRTRAPLAVNAAAVTHDNAEAQVAAAFAVFAVNAALTAAVTGDDAADLRRVCTEALDTARKVTRPAPLLLAALQAALDGGPAGADAPGAVVDTAAAVRLLVDGSAEAEAAASPVARMVAAALRAVRHGAAADPGTPAVVGELQERWTALTVAG